jgi:hypothetical protein
VGKWAGAGIGKRMAKMVVMTMRTGTGTGTGTLTRKMGKATRSRNVHHAVTGTRIATQKR